MTELATINPFFAARFNRAAPTTTLRPDSRPEPERPVYARLPRAPKNASPVPHLTSLYHFSRAGEYGDRRYPGNCGGNLIKDLLRNLKREACSTPARARAPAATCARNWAST